MTISDDDHQKLLQFKHMMVEAVRETKKRRVEHGFNVCEEDSKLVPSELCKGEHCSVGLKKCQWPHTFLDMHTHPPGAGIMLSVEDLVGSLTEHVKYVCIGNTYKGGAIRCYKVNHDDPAVRKLFDLYRAVYWDHDESKRMEMLDVATGYLFGRNKILELVEEWKRVITSSF